MRRLIAAGYSGPFSFKCTADLKVPIAESIAYLRRELSNANGLGDATAARLEQQQHRRKR